MKTVGIFGAFDTKEQEFLYLKKQIESYGLRTLCINTGMRALSFHPEVDCETVAQAAGTTIDALRKEDHGVAADTMKRGATLVVRKLYDEKKINGVVTIGGGTGMYVAKGVLSALPFGFPKAILSTHNTGSYGGYEVESVRDTISIKSLVDVAGLNHFMRSQMDTLAAAISSVVLAQKTDSSEQKRPRIAVSMLGITTKFVDRFAAELEAAGFEPIIFHANGDSGYQMERLIEEGCFDAVADVTLAEIIPQFIPSSFGYSGERRMLAAGIAGVPQLIIPGGMDVVNYPYGKHPPEYDGRVFHWHAASLEVMRTNPEENRIFGRVIAERVNTTRAKVAVMLPLCGISANDVEGKPFYSAESNQELFDSITKNLRKDIPVQALPFHINDPAFADAAAKTMIALCRNEAF